MKIVINECFGGFGISKEACEFMVKRGSVEAQEALDNGCYSPFFRSEEGRTDPHLVEAVETLGDKADGDYARLAIVDVPDDVNWYIDDYDGQETVREHHRSW